MFEAGDGELHLFDPLDAPEGARQCRHVLGEYLPLFGLEAVFGGGLQDLDDGLARNRRPPPQPAHDTALLLPFLRETAEFRVPDGNGREIEAIGFSDAPLRITMTVTLAVRAVLHADQTELDKLSVGRLDLRWRQAERFLLRPG